MQYKHRLLTAGLLAIALSCALASCGAKNVKASDKKKIAVTYSVLGSLVKELVGDQAEVQVMIPNGLDVHEWEPSAADMAALTKADLIVQNGIGLEGGMEKALEQAKKEGVPFFTASDHITVRRVGSGEGIPGDDPDQAAGAEDPHLWTDPMAAKAVVDALASDIESRFGIKVQSQREVMDRELEALDSEIRAKVESLPRERRRLVTGHESLGYFAQRYGFKLVGAVVPSLSTQAEVSAGELASLKKAIEANGVSVVFTETGTPAQVVQALAREANIKAVGLEVHAMPPDGGYLGFERKLAETVVEGLR